MTPELGLVFGRKRGTKKEYWKVVSAGYLNRMVAGESFTVRRCSKWGKEFSDTNGFQAQFFKRLAPNLDEYEDATPGMFTGWIQCREEIGVEASTAGLRRGQLKRRHAYLKEKITRYEKECMDIVKELWP